MPSRTSDDGHWPGQTDIRGKAPGFDSSNDAGDSPASISTAEETGLVAFDDFAETLDDAVLGVVDLLRRQPHLFADRIDRFVTQHGPFEGLDRSLIESCGLAQLGDGLFEDEA